MIQGSFNRNGGIERHEHNGLLIKTVNTNQLFRTSEKKKVREYDQEYQNHILLTHTVP